MAFKNNVGNFVEQWRIENSLISKSPPVRDSKPINELLITTSLKLVNPGQ